MAGDEEMPVWPKAAAGTAVLAKLRHHLRRKTNLGHRLPVGIEAHDACAALEAVVAFQQLPEAAALAAANKRIVNILKKADGRPGEPDVALLVEDAEKALFHAIVEVAPLARSYFQNEAYTDALRVLAGLRAAVDRFFDEVMVMAEEPLVRQNRLALLNQLAGLMNQVADISRLSA